VQASSYVIADAGTGQVLAAEDPHGHFLPASTLKVLTADALMPVLEPDATVVTSGLAADVTPNAEAHHLQADDTVAVRPNGLNAKGQHSSAYDLALFARQALTMREFMRIEATPAAMFPLPRRH
jgi:D-alanyl-D-alanine carboxypeptidase (penicillin-binding protein 5/6)